MSIDIKKTLNDGIELMKLKKYSDAEQKFRILLDLCYQIEQLPDHPESIYKLKASALEHLGNSLYIQKRLGEAYLKYNKALSIYKEKYPDEHLDQALCLQGLADVLQFIGDDDNANNYYQQAEKKYQLASDNIAAAYCHERYSIKISRVTDWFNMIGELLIAELPNNDIEVHDIAQEFLSRIKKNDV